MKSQATSSHTLHDYEIQNTATAAPIPNAQVADAAEGDTEESLTNVEQFSRVV